MIRFTSLALCALLANPVFGVESSEYAARRQRLAEAAGPDALVLFFSPAPIRRNNDVDWPFRQEDNLYYLTGVDEPDTILALLPGEPERREILFARDRDPLRELWEGQIPELEELARGSGIAEVLSVGKFDAFLRAALGGSFFRTDPQGDNRSRPASFPRFSRAVEKGRAVVWMRLEQRPGGGEPLTPELARVAELRRAWPELRFRDVLPVVEGMRMVKSPAELELLQRAVDVTVEAHKAAMRRALEADWEYQVEATIEFVFRDHGACCWGFPSIVASGERTTVLHYYHNDQRIPEGALMLLDIGAEVAHYTADVTHTFPADGTFSDEQRQIYGAVLAAWRAGLPRMRPGYTWREVNERVGEVVGEELVKLGLVSENVYEQVRLYLPHGIGHPIGLFVHDVLDNARTFEPGMALTLEPGIYVRTVDVTASDFYEGLEPEAKAELEETLARYEGIGVRIERDILVTDGDPVDLSGELPSTVEEIEAFMKSAAR